MRFFNPFKKPTSNDDPCAIGFQFGSVDDTSRFFPTTVLLLLRDHAGFNPGIFVMTVQFGVSDLLPGNVRTLSRAVRLFKREPRLLETAHG